MIDDLGTIEMEDNEATEARDDFMAYIQGKNWGLSTKNVSFSKLVCSQEPG